jgi:hypothetical protein
MVKPSSGKNSRTCQINNVNAIASDAAAGQRKFRFILSHEARRQAIIGPTAIRKTKNKNNGTVTELK